MRLKGINNIFVILFYISGCGGSTQSDVLMHIDVTKKHPQKDLMLQSFMDVEYIALETTDEFVCQGIVLDIGKDIMLIKNQIRDGNIYIFDRKGNGLGKFNRMGRGGEEYVNISGAVLDEENEEIIVNDLSTRKILVYSLYGNFKRSFNHKEGANYNKICNFNKENLISHDGNTKNDEEINKQSFAVISKQDGSVVFEIQIPFKHVKSTFLTIPNAPINIPVGIGSPHFEIISHQGSWILTEPSSDTIFRFFPDFSMSPFIVRTPSIQSMSPEIFLFPSILTERYYFMESVRKEYNFATNTGFPKTHLMYDRKEQTTYECAVFNDDFSIKSRVNMFNASTNNEIVFWQKIEADDLFEAHEKGQLKGSLKEIAAELEKESNPVIMLVRYKK